MDGKTPGIIPSCKQEEIIGIAGGLGPYAHIDFERKLLESARELAGANQDQDFPEWILSSVPQTPDRTMAMQGDAEDPFPWLLRSVKRLEDGGRGPGADFIAIPCNTAHRYLSRLRDEASVPILDMIDETCVCIRNRHEKVCVGLLATTGTVVSGLYHEALGAYGMRVVSPLDLPEGEDAQEQYVMAAIYGPKGSDESRRPGIKAVGPRPEFTRMLVEGAKRLVNELGAQVIVAGCTEIPLALSQADLDPIPLLDPTKVLADAAIRRAYGLAD